MDKRSDTDMRTIRTIHAIRIAFAAVLVLCTTTARAAEGKSLFDLRGEWRFEIGDDPQRSDAAYDDSGWELIYAPSAWEEEGFPGYDGYAWYRKHFQAKPEWRGKALTLVLGYIDDVDETYINGQLVGATGTFPPRYSTAYNVHRIYTIPAGALNYNGDNLVTVRVYDHELSGGMLRGKLGVYEDPDVLVPDIVMEGKWKFSKGDDLTWKDRVFDDSRWGMINVPAFWERQGYEEYDGFGWYRTRVRVSDNLLNERLILLLGKIDDLDEAFFNGERIGKTGHFSPDWQPGSDEYLQLRAYTIPSGLIRAGTENVIAVRVFDGYRDGGIYAGPIGIVTRERYLKWKDRSENSLWRIFENIFK